MAAATDLPTDIVAVLEAMLSRLEGMFKQAQEPFMTAQEVGEHYKCTSRHILESVAKVPGFPKPVRLPTKNGHMGHPLWRRKDIFDYDKKLRP